MREGPSDRESLTIVVAHGRFELLDGGGRVVDTSLQGMAEISALIALGERRGSVTVSGAVLRFLLVYLMPREHADAYMQAIHASWPIKRFPAEALSAIQALVATGDMPCVVNYIKFAREANRL